MHAQVDKLMHAHERDAMYRNAMMPSILSCSIGQQISYCTLFQHAMRYVLRV